MKTMNKSTASLETHIRNCSWNGRLTAILVALVGLPLVIDCQAQAPKQPPFDFSDAFYLSNGINLANVITHVDGTCPASDKPSCSVVDNSNTDPNRRNIRVLSTTGGFDADGNVLYYNIFARVPSPSAFTNNAAGQQAMQIANFFSAYHFPKASGDPLSPELSNRRQDNVFDTRNGYNVANPLGLWTLVFVSYTPAAFNTPQGRQALAALAARNGTDLDGTPIIKAATEVDALETRGFAVEQTRALDGSQGFPWVVCPIIANPRNGAIAPDAFLKNVLRPDGSPVDPEVATQFLCLQQTGSFCRSR
jgi:hypothetical protein